MIPQLFEPHTTKHNTHMFTLIHPENREINHLKSANLLDEKGRPVCMTHITTEELSDAEGHTLSIYENVMLSPLHASRSGHAIIFDRDGRAFECLTCNLQKMEHVGRYATAV